MDHEKLFANIWQNLSFLSYKYVSQELYQTLLTTKLSFENCYAETKFSKTTIAIRFYLLQFCPPCLLSYSLGYSRLPVTRTLYNLNLPLTRTFFYFRLRFEISRESTVSVTSLNSFEQLFWLMFCLVCWPFPLFEFWGVSKTRGRGQARGWKR